MVKPKRNLKRLKHTSRDRDSDVGLISTKGVGKGSDPPKPRLITNPNTPRRHTTLDTHGPLGTSSLRFTLL